MGTKRSVWGIICEFNPLHMGHAGLLSEARKNGATHIVCVMSGNFTQRGEPALLLKHVRAKAALLSGADLVLELPLPWALAGAEKFSLGGITLLNALGTVDTLFFGSECGDISLLTEVSRLLLSEELSPLLKKELSSGISFASAREKALAALSEKELAAVISTPNNILATEYLKACALTHAPFSFFTVPRFGQEHESRIAAGYSAGAIREKVLRGEDVASLLPPASGEILQQELAARRAPVSIKAMELPILARLRSMENFRSLPDLSEGLDCRIHAASRKAKTLEELYSLAKSKRYSHARIRRAVLSAYLGLNAALPSLPPYLRVLGMNSRGRELLADRKNTLPLVTRWSELSSLSEDVNRVFSLECRATDLYALACPEILPCGLEKSTGLLSL